jgi:FixJ family two-component response regulator
MKVMEKSKLKFFIVDDDHFCRMLYHQHLVNLGYQDNLLFDNGYDCIEKMNLQPDVIFLDYDMKSLNGIEVLRAVKQINSTAHLLILSGNDDSRIAVDAMKYGAYDFIKKGDRDLEKISTVINRICAASK